MSSSAAFERGVILHGNGTGCLRITLINNYSSFSPTKERKKFLRKYVARNISSEFDLISFLIQARLDVEY